MKALTIEPVVSRMELACQYVGQTNPQPCYIQLDLEERTLSAHYNAEMGNAVPMDVWHGHVKRYPIPALFAEEANDLMAEIEPLARRVVDGYTSEWDGSNNVANLTDDAQKADEDLKHRSYQGFDADETMCIQIRTASEWFDECSDEAHGKTDAELEALSREWEAEANTDGVYITNDILNQLIVWRDEGENDML